MKDTIQGVEELIKFAKKHGLKRIKAGSLEIEFSEVTAPRKRVRLPKGQKMENIPTEELTEDELLDWSSGG